MKDPNEKSLFKQILPALIIVAFGVTLYQILDNLGSFSQQLAHIYRLINPFVLGIILAYIINPIMGFEEQTLFCKIKSRTIKRVCSISLSMLILLGFILVFLWVCIPMIRASIASLAASIPDGVVRITNYIRENMTNLGFDVSNITILSNDSQKIMDFLLNFSDRYLPQVIDLGVGIGRLLYDLIIAIISAVYLLFGKEKMLNQCKRIIYALFNRDRADYIIHICQLSNKTFGNFISGKIVDSIIIGILCFAGMTVFKIPYAMLVSIIVGVTNIIPFFGPFIGAVPSFFIILLQDPTQALWFLLFVFVLQQLDGNIIGPKILGQHTGLSAFWVMVAIIVSGGFLGVLGMVIGVPLFSICYTLMGEFLRKRLKKNGLPTDWREYEALGKYVDTRK